MIGRSTTCNARPTVSTCAAMSRVDVIEYTILPSGRLRPRLSPAPRQTANNTFLTAKDAAELLNVSLISLGRWRIEGSGPPFCKFGRVVRYERSTRLDWARSRARASTSE
jgi:hypothetical protein